MNLRAFFRASSLFEIAWRVAILLLPWQTRWFLDAQLAGWPWEQGRISIYLSWIPLGLTLILGARLKPIFVRAIPRQILVPLGLLVASTILATRLELPALRAVFQWWVQIVLLTGFVFMMRRHAIPWPRVATWFVIALLPHIVLGLVQYATQRVWGSSFLGIAGQLPERAGVSVVEHGLYRVLRVYGGFPHPNIFGGWLVVGILTSLLLAARSDTKARAVFAMMSASFGTIVVLLTYSRSAWLALAVGSVTLLIVMIRTKRLNQFFMLACAVSLLAGGIVGISQRDHLLARGDTSLRLETKSIDARTESLRNGLERIRARPLFGSGPNADLLLHTPQSGIASAPLEPPHNVLVLALAQLGIVGVVLLSILLVQLKRSRRVPLIHALVFFVPLCVIGMFDHYLWSYWPGQALLLSSVLLARPSVD